MICDLDVLEYRNSDKDFPQFSRPSIIGHFSVDKDRNYVNDISGLQFLHLPESKNVYLNLNRGYGTAICKNEHAPSEKIDHILKFIIHNSKRLCNVSDPTKPLKADIICFRGLLTCLMCTPFENRDGWSILATHWRGTTYICAWESEEKKRKRIQDVKKHRKFMSWGYKFEQYLLSQSPDIQPDASKPVNENEEFCCIFASKLGTKNLLFGAEIDGINHSQMDAATLRDLKLDPKHLVELKTNRIISTDNQNYNFKKNKLIKWWCQSFLVGIERILCGCRDDNGIVHEIKPFLVKDIPKINENLWKANSCMNFCDDILSFIQNISKTRQNEVIRFDWNPRDRITYVIDEVNTILPSWYCETINKLIQ